jgi:hypothetical protein
MATYDQLMIYKQAYELTVDLMPSCDVGTQYKIPTDIFRTRRHEKPIIR